MELIVFDLDGTLLNSRGQLSQFSQDTLLALSQRGIAYTVATGRSLHASRQILQGQGFRLPQVFKNGVMIWNPQNDAYSHQSFLNLHEVQHVLEAILDQQLTPFIFTFEPGNRHAIYHGPLQNGLEASLLQQLVDQKDVAVGALAQLPAEAEITSISAIGLPTAVSAVEQIIQNEQQLIAYVGTAWEDKSWRWIDIHHADASKGAAIDMLRQQLGLTRVVCFGDSENDLSMFARADEAYAPANANAEVKAAATAVIGHHDEDGIARFLRERFLSGTLSDIDQD